MPTMLYETFKLLPLNLCLLHPGFATARLDAWRQALSDSIPEEPKDD